MRDSVVVEDHVPEVDAGMWLAAEIDGGRLPAVPTVDSVRVVAGILVSARVAEIVKNGNGAASHLSKREQRDVLRARRAPP